MHQAAENPVTLAEAERTVPNACSEGVVCPYELGLSGARNVRDLGGYPYRTENGDVGRTVYGVFLRAGTLRRLRSADFERLRTYRGGVRRVVDVRSSFETSHWADPYVAGRDGVVYTHVPMLDQLNSGGFRDALPDRMATVYCSLLDNDAASIRHVMEALDGEGCALFHCRAGKDRTGVIAMLLLGLAGCSDVDIVSDYAATQRFAGRGLRAQRIAVSVLLRRRAPRCLFEALPSEMEFALAHLHERYGTARAYLQEYTGCPSALLDRLTARLRGQMA